VRGLEETSELHPPVEYYQEFQVGLNLNFCRETRVTTLLRVENLLGRFQAMLHATIPNRLLPIRLLGILGK